MFLPSLFFWYRGIDVFVCSMYTWGMANLRSNPTILGVRPDSNADVDVINTTDKVLYFCNRVKRCPTIKNGGRTPLLLIIHSLL